jgi:hypothetical protein
MSTKIIAPGSRLDFLWAWRDNSRGMPWLEAGETISAYTLTADGGVVLASHQLVNANSDVLAWLEFSEVAGQRCWVDCEVTTTAGRQDARRFEFVIGVRGED